MPGPEFNPNQFGLYEYQAALETLIGIYGDHNYRSKIIGRLDRQPYHIFWHKKPLDLDFGLEAIAVEYRDQTWQLTAAAAHFAGFGDAGLADIHDKIYLPRETKKLPIVSTTLTSLRPNQGLGSALVVEMQHELDTIPCLEVVCFTDEGIRVKHYYEHLGFAPTMITHPERMSLEEKRLSNWMYKIHGQ